MPSVDTAVILCGGEARRAGFDKQLLPCEGTTLPQAIARRLEAAFHEIIIVTNKPHLYDDPGLVVVEDLVKGAGPLGGILTGLRRSTSDCSYVIAGDMPHPNLAYIRWMMRALAREDFDVAVTRVGDDHIEPFNSFFSARCAPLIESSLARGDRSVCSFIRQCDRVLFIPEQEARSFSPDWGMFANINTAADVELYLRSMSGRVTV